MADPFSDSDSIDGEEGRLDIIEQYSDDEEQIKGNQVQGKHTNGNDEKEDSSSEDESEDEDGEQMTADVDAAILSTLAKIRRKDESIYQAGKRIFDEERQNASQSKLLPKRLHTENGSGKKVTLAKYQRARIQELLKTSDDPARALAEETMIERRSDEVPSRQDDDDDDDKPIILSHNQEQEKIRREVTNAFHSIVDDNEDEGDFFTKKSNENHFEGDAAEDDPESYRKYLLDILGGKEEEIRDILRSQTKEAAAGDGGEQIQAESSKQIPHRKHISMHAQGDEKENEDFLVNYVLNRGWTDNPQSAPKGTGKSKKELSENDDHSDAETDDSFDSRAEAYETAYNFRFQEMEDSQMNPQIQSYARMIEGSARRQENKRKREREERASRKAQEKESKRKQLDKVRDQKRKSIVDRLKTLKEATGSTAINFDQLDLDADFNPEEHDQLMARAFNDDYYGEGDAYDEDEDGEKPTWDDDIDISEILREQEEHESRNEGKEKKGKAKQSAPSAFVDEDGERIVMDADYNDEDNYVEEEHTGKKLSKAEKKKLKKREKAKAKKAEEADQNAHEIAVDADDMDADAVNEDESSLAKENLDELNPLQRKKKMEEMMNEYYGLEYEDMIGDQPTRFKYTEVSKSDYGLTPVEILLADDAELNKVVNLKNFQPYRAGNSKRGPPDIKSRLKEFRRTLYKGDRKTMAEAYGGTAYGSENATGANAIKPKKAGKRERERKKVAAAAAAAAAAKDDEESSATRKSDVQSEESNEMSKRQREDEADSGRKEKRAKKEKTGEGMEKKQKKEKKLKNE